MAEETVRQGTQAAGAAAGTQNGTGGTDMAPRTFTQAELDAIVGDRLARERAKYADYDTLKEKASRFDAAENASKTDLQRAQEQASQYKTELDALKKANTVRELRDRVAAEKKVPASLLTGDTEELCREQADAILAFANPKGYPAVPDGGEVRTGGSASARDKFAEWAKEQNI